MRKIINKTLIGLLVLLAIWAFLTLWVERKGKSKTWETGDPATLQKILIVYDPDPFYNLDQQVCAGFGKAFEDGGWHITFATVAAAHKMATDSFTLYVFCANTYNWSPDWAITSYINENVVIKERNVVALTVGGGSTTRAKRIFENVIKESGGILLDSKEYWLWRPNDKFRLKEPNGKIAAEMAKKFGGEILAKIKSV